MFLRAKGKHKDEDRERLPASRDERAACAVSRGWRPSPGSSAAGSVAVCDGSAASLRSDNRWQHLFRRAIGKGGGKKRRSKTLCNPDTDVASREVEKPLGNVRLSFLLYGRATSFFFYACAKMRRWERGFWPFLPIGVVTQAITKQIGSEDGEVKANSLNSCQPSFYFCVIFFFSLSCFILIINRRCVRFCRYMLMVHVRFTSRTIERSLQIYN